MPTTYASQSITRDQPPFWYCAAGVPGLSTATARPSRPYLESRLVHPAWIFVHNRRHRMCVSATDCVTDACACSSLASRFLRARACRPPFFPLPSDRPSQWAICGNATKRYTRSLPNRLLQNSREYWLWSWSKGFVFWARTQRKTRAIGSRLVSRSNAPLRKLNRPTVEIVL